MKWRGVLGFAIPLLVIAGIWFALRQAVYSPMNRVYCKRNLLLVGGLLQAYHDEHGHFPPAFTTDQSGRRLHSWRVLLLPYFEEGSEEYRTYSMIDLSKSWDHPANAAARDRCPFIYRCPGNDLAPGSTTYKALVGDATIFPADGSTTSLDDIVDGSTQTVAIVETAPTQSVHWMDPTDNGLNFFLTAAQRQIPHCKSFNAVFADSVCSTLAPDTAPDVLIALTTIAGREVIDNEDF